MLADTGADDRITTRVSIDLLDHIVRLHQRAVTIVGHPMSAAQLAQVASPGRKIGPRWQSRAPGCELWQRFGEQPDVAPLCVLDLVNLGPVYIQMRNSP